MEGRGANVTHGASAEEEGAWIVGGDVDVTEVDVEHDVDAVESIVQSDADVDVDASVALDEDDADVELELRVRMRLFWLSATGDSMQLSLPLPVGDCTRTGVGSKRILCGRNGTDKCPLPPSIELALALGLSMDVIDLFNQLFEGDFVTVLLGTGGGSVEEFKGGVGVDEEVVRRERDRLFSSAPLLLVEMTVVVLDIVSTSAILPFADQGKADESNRPSRR